MGEAISLEDFIKAIIAENEKREAEERERKRMSEEWHRQNQSYTRFWYCKDVSAEPLTIPPMDRIKYGF